jgi:hypothetical protein
MSETIKLADFLEDLRAELTEALRRGGDAELRFATRSIDLELQIAADAKKDGSGKISFKLFGIGAEGGGGGGSVSSSTQILKMSLDLVDRDGARPLISARSRDEDV